MKKYLSILIPLLFTLNCAVGQKINLDKWVKRNIDSLRGVGVDTAVYYHSYCGECQVLDLRRTDTGHVKVKKQHCEIDNSWTQIDNIIIYQQKGQFFSLSFNCSYPPTKKALLTGNSIPYFISLIPVLNSRDRYYKSSIKKGKFLPPIVSDGSYEGAEIYLKNIHQHVYMHEDQKTNTAWRKYFWIDKQTQLFALIRTDISK